jgi:hypothetical protein
VPQAAVGDQPNAFTNANSAGQAPPQPPARSRSAPVGDQPAMGPACCAVPVAEPTPIDVHLANPAQAPAQEYDEHPHAANVPAYLPVNAPNGVPMNVHIAGKSFVPSYPPFVDANH